MVRVPLVERKRIPISKTLDEIENRCMEMALGDGKNNCGGANAVCCGIDGLIDAIRRLRSMLASDETIEDYAALALHIGIEAMSMLAANDRWRADGLANGRRKSLESRKQSSADRASDIAAKVHSKIEAGTLPTKAYKLVARAIGKDWQSVRRAYLKVHPEKKAK